MRLNGSASVVMEESALGLHYVDEKINKEIELLQDVCKGVALTNIHQVVCAGYLVVTMLYTYDELYE